MTIDYSLKNLLNLDPAIVAKMTKKELTKAVAVLRKSIMAGLKRLGKTPAGRLSPAYRAWVDAGKPLYRTKGLTQGEMQHVFKMARIARKRKTSTVKGWKEYRKKVFEGDKDVASGGFYGGSYDSEYSYWQLYNEMKNEYPGVPSKVLIAAVSYAIDHSSDPDEQRRLAREFLNKQYEAYERARQEAEKEAGNFYGFDDEENTENADIWD